MEWGEGPSVEVYATQTREDKELGTCGATVSSALYTEDDVKERGHLSE